MKMQTRALLIGGFVLLAAVTGETIAKADVTAGYSGSPQYASEASCWTESYGSAWNLCAAAKTYTVYLSNVQLGSHIRAHVGMGQPGSSATCTYQAIDKTHTVVYTNSVPQSFPGGDILLSGSGSYGPAYSAEVDCYMPYDGYFNSVWVY